ncbi:MAG: hypothetical protein A2Y15_09530 [Clostridiales bacterium GWF2_36_10]|nr:MAG: hypothetical protein A2Y15_09530 [Clostridiales bacterium GWF2_36_10]HAN21923.1 hypothetical protein [Clostridiales bacterium]
MKKTTCLLISTILLCTLASCLYNDKNSETVNINSENLFSEDISKEETSSSNETSEVISEILSEDENTSSDITSENDTVSQDFEQVLINNIDNKFNEYIHILLGVLEYNENDKIELNIDNNSYIYFGVIDDKYKTANDILDFLKTLYTYERAEILYNELFSKFGEYPPIYSIIDGNLYIYGDIPPTGIECGSFTEYAIIEKNNDGTLTLNMPFGYDNIPDGVNKIILVYSEGNWVISSGDLWGECILDYSEFNKKIINDLHNKYFECFYIFSGGLEHNEKAKTELVIDNHTYVYFKVTEDKYKTANDIFAFLKTLYVYDKAEIKYNKLFENNRIDPPYYIEVNNQLYVLEEYPPMGYETVSYTENATVERNRNGTLTVNIPYGDDVEIYGLNEINLIYQECNWVIFSSNIWGCEI